MDSLLVVVCMRMSKLKIILNIAILYIGPSSVGKRKLRAQFVETLAECVFERTS